MPNLNKRQMCVLREVLRAARMEGMSVAFPRETVSVSGSYAGEHDGIFCTDDFIRDRTELYRESWIIGPLEELLKELEK